MPEPDTLIAANGVRQTREPARRCMNCRHYRPNHHTARGKVVVAPYGACNAGGTWQGELVSEWWGCETEFSWRPSAGSGQATS